MMGPGATEVTKEVLGSLLTKETLGSVFMTETTTHEGTIGDHNL